MQVQRRTRRRHPDSTSPQWAALVGLRPGLLRQVARKRAVLDAGAFVACTSRRTVHRHTTWPRCGASTPRIKHVAASCGRSARTLLLGHWPGRV